MSAPLAKRNRPTTIPPCLAASWSGAQPSLFLALIKSGLFLIISWIFLTCSVSVESVPEAGKPCRALVFLAAASRFSSRFLMTASTCASINLLIVSTSAFDFKTSACSGPYSRRDLARRCSARPICCMSDSKTGLGKFCCTATPNFSLGKLLSSAIWLSRARRSASELSLVLDREGSAGLPSAANFSRLGATRAG